MSASSEPFSLGDLLAQFAPATAHEPHEQLPLDEDSEGMPGESAQDTTIRQEKTRVREALAAGRTLVRNRVKDGPAVIHDAECPTIEHLVNRDRAWSYVRAFPGEIERPERVPGWAVRTDPGEQGPVSTARVALFPELLTPEEVEALPRYRLCGTCQPPIRAAGEVRPGPKTLTFGALTLEHLGQRFASLDGDELGELLGISVTLRFPEGAIRGRLGDLVVLPEAGTAPEPGGLA